MKTYREILTFVEGANMWLNSHDGKDTKFHYAIRKVKRKMEREIQRYYEAVEDINIEFCAVDDKDIILRDERNQFRYTRANMQKRNDKIRLLSDKAIEVEPHISTDTPELTEDEQDLFAGFVLKANDT